jgi:hypothetical protein
MDLTSCLAILTNKFYTGKDQIVLDVDAAVGAEIAFGAKRLHGLKPSKYMSTILRS